MEIQNKKINRKFQILLMGQYKNLFIRGAFPSLKKSSNKEYKKIINYNNCSIEIDIIEIDDPSFIEEENIIKNNIQNDGIIALFVIDGTDENYLVEIDSLIDELKLKNENKIILINDYILLGIIPKNFNIKNNYFDEYNLPLFVFHKLAEKKNCFCYEMDESEEEIDYNIFFVNYAMLFWIEFDKIYSNEELREIIEKNSGYENKLIKFKNYSEKELKNLDEKKKKNLQKGIFLLNKEKEKKGLSDKKILKLKNKEEIKRQNCILDILRKKYILKNNNLNENKDKEKLNNINNIWNWSFQDNKDRKMLKDKLFELYNQDNSSIFRCIYCKEIPEIEVLNEKYVKIKCQNYMDENHKDKNNILTIDNFHEINFYLKNRTNQINYNKNKCIYCNKSQKDIIKDIENNFENKYLKDQENMSLYQELKNNFFYYFNDNKIFFCNICREYVCQKCKNFHLLFCKNFDKNIEIKNEKENIMYENYEEIKYLIDEKIIDYESEIKLNKQFMPLYMYDTFCSKHKKPYNYFCENCKINLCNDCINHNNHKILDWFDIENIMILKQEEIKEEKKNLNNIALKVNELIQYLSIYLNTLIQKQRDIINFKEKILINAKYINNNYNIYKNLKNIHFNKKTFKEDIYLKENDVLKKLNMLFEYLNEPYSIINQKIFNKKSKENIYKNISMINNFINNKKINDKNENLNYSITSFLIFDEKKINDNIFSENIFVYSTNNGDANFYKIDNFGKSKKITSFYLFPKNQGIFDLKKIGTNKVLLGGYEKLKIINVKLNKKTYNIINIIYYSKNYFIKNWVLNTDIILSYFQNKNLKLIKYKNNNDYIPWKPLELINKNKSMIKMKDINVEFIINNRYEIISLIKLKNGKSKNRFVISISNNERPDNILNEKNKIKYNDVLIFYNISENENNDNKINLEKIISLPSIEKSENNLFEIAYSNLLICKLGSLYENIVIINSNNYSIENNIQLSNCKLNINNNFFKPTFFMKYKSLNFKGDYYLSINKTLDLIQWHFNIKEKKFIPIEDISLRYIKDNNKDIQNSHIKKLLFFQLNKCFIVLTNDNLIFNIYLES